MHLKPGFNPPSIDNSCRLVHFRHPAYPDTEPDLLRLGALDRGNENGDGDGDGNGDGNGNGIQYDFALASCCVVTGNTFANGWLATRVLPGNGQNPLFHRVSRPEDGILRDGEYHFCVGEEDPTTFKYPVIPSFDHWRFPHGHLPPPWNNLSVDLDAAHHSVPLKGKVAALVRDGACRISGYGDAVEAAHLVPLTNGHWFSSNNMARYCRSPTDPHPINDERNLITLRRDLHHLLDTRRFTLAAKPVPASPQPSSPTTPPPGAQLALHVTLPSPSGQLEDLYHNRALQPVRGIAVEFLFARFAWTLFADETMPFLNGAVRHNVLLFDPAEGCLGEESLRAAEVHERAANVFEMCFSSRSVRPRKRPRLGCSLALTDAEDFEMGGCSVPPFDLDGSDEEEEGWDAGEVYDESDEEQRGRKR
ncbi:hypothetical protein F5144DRAFT_381999 [Chaetomium tenue]|uniref:Uncharacterized protein n=1 Tax=Chaetomium tenue TaxID=1854479 RepID=A0ACB7NUS0_9PEZI|nr:hypothetical protein F5144DRAFT_381999 [Chaetomium globosum]